MARPAAVQHAPGSASSPSGKSLTTRSLRGRRHRPTLIDELMFYRWI
jgi:hypothetical protein